MSKESDALSERTLMFIGLFFIVVLVLVSLLFPIQLDLSPNTPCFGNNITNPLTCDYRFAAHDTFILENVTKFGFKTNGITMPGNPLGSPGELKENTPEHVKAFLTMSAEDIEANMSRWIEAKNLAGTTDLIVLDIEYPVAIHPRFWSNILADEEPLLPAKDFSKLMTAFQLRIAIAKKLLPKAKLSLFGIVTPHSQGNDKNYNMSGYIEAIKYGVYDNLTGISPILYARGDNCDPDGNGQADDPFWPYVEKYTQQGITNAKLVTKSDGSKLLIYPVMSTTVANPSSPCNNMVVSKEYVYRQNAALQKIPGVKIASYWIAPNDPDSPNVLVWLSKTRPVPRNCFCK